jgi:site-specific recombinase XerD
MIERGTHTLDDAYEMFMLDCEARRLTPATRKFYRAKLSVFFQWCSANAVDIITDLTAHKLRQYFVYLQRRNLSGQYQHNIARAIRAFLNYCVRDELTDVSPFNKVQMPRVEKKILAALDTADIRVLLKHCQSQRDRALCLFLLDSGVRASELIALNIGHVDVKTGIVNVHRGKGQKGRTTYIGATTRKYLLRYLRTRSELTPEMPLFVSETTGASLTVSGLVQLMERLRRRSGISACTCHAFRRTFALNCLRNGMNIYVLARLMGHADIIILRQYLPLIENDLQDAHARFGAVDRLMT